MDVLQYILIPIINSVTSINPRKDSMTSPAKYCYEKAIHVVMTSFLWAFFGNLGFFVLNIFAD